VRVSDLVNNLKTVTSRRLRAEFPAVRAAYGDKAVLWSPSYCVVSAQGAPLGVLKRYIEGQQRPE
jgi:putative transposase